MKDSKRFKDFRNELNENEYREVLTGYPNRDIHTDGPMRYDAEMIGRVNAMLNAISRGTYLHPGEAFLKIKTRLNILMLDFPWTPYLWQDGGVGNVTLTVTRYGRVDGFDALTGAVRMDGKANTMDGFREFILSAEIERAEDGLFRVSASLSEREQGQMEESVEEETDVISEWREAGMEEVEGEDLQEDKIRYKRILTGVKTLSDSQAPFTVVVISPSDKVIMQKLVKGKNVLPATINTMISSDLKGKSWKAISIEGSGGVLNVLYPKDVMKESMEESWGGGFETSREAWARIAKQERAEAKRAREAKKAKEKASAKAKKTVKEGLVGNQQKLDVNKNKRLDSQDFKLLRAKKKPVKEEAEVVEEGKTAKIRRLQNRLGYKAANIRSGYTKDTPEAQASIKKMKGVVSKLSAEQEKTNQRRAEAKFPKHDPKIAKMDWDQRARVKGGSARAAAVQRAARMQKEEANLEFTTGLPLQVPNPGDNIADPTKKGKRLHKKAK
jgi:hypothetical protein